MNEMERFQDRQICSLAVTSFVQGCKGQKHWQIHNYLQNITCKVEKKNVQVGQSLMY